MPHTPLFTRREAAAAGWTQSALTHAVRCGRLRRLRRGVYAASDGAGAHVDALGVARAYPHGAVSHRTALLLHGLPVLGGHPLVPEFTVPPRSRANMPRVHVHRATMRPQDLTFIDGISVTSVPRTLVDVARHRPLAAGVAAIDSALYNGRTSVDEIGDVLRSCWNWPRIARGQLATRLCDGRAESPLETISRLALRWLRLPDRDLQVTIFDQYGRFIGRSDFYWDEVGVIGEADGLTKYDDRTVLVREKQRQEALEDLGLVVVRWGWEAVTRRRYELRTRLENAFLRGHRRDRSGFPRQWTL